MIPVARPWNRERAIENVKKLRRMCEMQDYIDAVRERVASAGTARSAVVRAKAYIAKEPPAISGQKGHNQCFHVACILINGFGLSTEEAMDAIQDWNRTCKPPWSEKELLHKFDDAHKRLEEKGYLLGKTWEGDPQNGHASPPQDEGLAKEKPNADNSTDPKDQDATAADLITHNATIRWAWDKWLQIGVLNMVAAEPGAGKTRFCADLCRRIYLGLPWPDGTAMTFPPGSKSLWVPADNQHAELGSLPSEFGFAPESVYLNATKRNPFGGTMLDSKQDLLDFEARIRRIKPAIIFVDTTLNATDKSAHKPEDAKAFFVPLQQIAARNQVVLVGITHLNAAGKPLGRRIMGQARIVIQLEQPDPENQEHRRRLWVAKSNSLMPPELGVTMGSDGNEYDFDPPKAPAEGPGGKGKKEMSPELKAAVEWLGEQVIAGPKKVHLIRNEATNVAGISAATLYKAKDRLKLEEFEAEGKKWWALTPDEKA